VWWSILISNFVMAGIGLVFYKMISFEPRIKDAPKIIIPPITKPA
jgi:hypothetical protein